MITFPVYLTVDDALAAVAIAEEDVAADFGEEYVDTAYADLVDSVALDCPPSVRRELRRVTGTQDRPGMRYPKE